MIHAGFSCSFYLNLEAEVLVLLSGILIGVLVGQISDFGINRIGNFRERSTSFQ